MSSPLSDWRRIIREHPYVDTAVILVFITLAAGGVRWWGRTTAVLTVDGKTWRVVPKVQTVGELLQQQSVRLGPEDFSTPPHDALLARNTTIQVTRVAHRTEFRLERGKPRIYRRVQLKSNLRPVLVERGFVQQSSQTVQATYYNGVKVKEKVLRNTVTRQPVFTLTLFDRKTGRPEKMYDLMKSEMKLMRATGYYVGEKYVPSDTTFLGYKLRRGLVAVDPKVIPLRSRLYVKGYGYAYAADTGSAIKGNRIDLAVKDKAEEQKFNRHNVQVYILEKTKKW